MGDGVDPKPRRITVADRAVEQIDVGGSFLEQRVECIIQEFEPGEFGIAKIDDNARLFGELDAGLADSLFERPGRCRLGRRRFSSLALSAPHKSYLAVGPGPRKPYKPLFPFVFAGAGVKSC